MKSWRTIFSCSVLALSLLRADAQKIPPEPALTITENSAQDNRSLIPPFPVHFVNPAFPSKVKKKDARGEIVLHAVVTTQGSLRDISIVSGSPVLATAAIDAVRQWRYLPATRDGLAVEVPRTINLKYDLSKDSPRPEDPISAPTAPPENLMHELESGDLFRVGPGITAPKAVYAPDPEYTEDARRERFQGEVVLGVVVDADGSTRSVWVVRSLGRGLDEKSVQTVNCWKFAPATKGGKPVPVIVNVEATFRIY